MTDEYIKRLVTCINRIDGTYYDMARASAAGQNEAALLYALSYGEELSQKSICEEWLIPKTTINTIVHRLLGEGYIEVCARGGKEKLLSLTDSGRAYAQRVLGAMKAAEKRAIERTLESFSPQFICALEAFSAYLLEDVNKNDD